MSDISEKVLQAASSALTCFKDRRLLIHCITNYVTVNDCANALLAAGPSPVMSHGPGEAAIVTASADALVLNLGATEYLTAMEASARAAAESGIPMILDPVGSAGNPFRREMAGRLMSLCKPAVIRGNAAELLSLARDRSIGRGVDDSSENAAQRTGIDEDPELMTFARQSGCILCASGRTDRITDGRTLLFLENGCAMMGRVTGTGCMLSALTGAFMAAGNTKKENMPEPQPPLFFAAAAAAFMGIAGEMALERTLKCGGGTGSFHIALIDSLFLISEEDLMERIRVRS